MVTEYDVDFRKTVEKKFFKLAKRNPKQLKMILGKIKEILQNPYHYKPLRKPLQHLRRVHIDSSFVLVFSIDEESHKIVIEVYEHHDNIYRT